MISSCSSFKISGFFEFSANFKWTKFGEAYNTTADLATGTLNDAVIVWGDNINGPEGADNLRFIFTANFGGVNTGTAGTWNSNEMARFTPTGRLGVGNFATAGAAYPGGSNGSGIQPHRKVEIYGENNDAFLNTAAPQLRLTHTPNANVTLGIWTDFEATANGDMLINPRNAGNRRRVGINIANTPQATLDVLGVNAGTLPQLRLTQFAVTTGNAGTWTDFQTTTNGDLFISPNTASGTTSIVRNVGIHTSTPGNTLEINSSAGSSTPGNSGLRFTDLRPTSTPGTANGLQLTVDGNGDVILVTDGGGSANGICPGGALDYLMKYTGSSTSCTSGIIETSSELVGIGTASPIGKTSIVSTTPLIDGRVFTTNANYPVNLGANYFSNVIPSSPSSYTNQTNIYAYTEGESNTGNVVSGSFETYDRSTSAFSTYGVKGVASSETSRGRDQHYIAGVNGSASAKRSNQYVKGGLFLAKGTGAEHDGVLAQANGSSGINRGVYGHAYGAATSNYGVMAYAVNATNNYGISVTSAGGTNSYGINSSAGGGTNNYGIYSTTPIGNCSSLGCTDAAGYFNGDLFHSGNIYTSSDIKLKQNIQSLHGASQILSQFNTKTYNFDLSGYPGMNLNSGTQYGFIAQDVEQFMPAMVKNFLNPAVLDSLGNTIYPEVQFKALSYETLIPILVAAFQEQKAELDSVKSVLVNLSAQPKSNLIPASNSQRVILSDAQAILLHQNDPNPFSESTVIRFSIPESVKLARIIFTNGVGAILKTATIETRGEGNMEVFASDLSSGI